MTVRLLCCSFRSFSTAQLAAVSVTSWVRAHVLTNLHAYKFSCTLKIFRDTITLRIFRINVTGRINQMRIAIPLSHAEFARFRLKSQVL